MSATISFIQRVKRLPTELKVAAIADFFLFLTMFLPWYQKSFFTTTGGHTTAVTGNLSAFQVFSFVEGAILLVVLAVFYLIWARIEGKTFRLPGGDGMAIIQAGSWIAVLLIWRLFDKPHVSDAAVTVGVQWGIFGALLASAALIISGVRLRNPSNKHPVATSTLTNKHHKPSD